MKLVMVEEKRERQLADDAIQGNRQAFEELYTSFQERLLAMIRTQMSPSLAQRLDPEDVLQETFIRALRSVKDFEWQGGDSFCRWLEGIATHLVLTAANRQSVKRELHIQRDPEADQVSPSRDMRRDERFERLRKSIESLSPDYRTVLRLSRLEGLTTKEIAKRMERSPSAIKNLLLRATKQLRQTFGDTESLHLGDRCLGAGEKKDGR